MNPQEKLKNIKEKLYEHNDHEMCDGLAEMVEDDIPWLIARVEQLEAVILDLYGSDCVAMKTGPKPART